MNLFLKTTVLSFALVGAPFVSANVLSQGAQQAISSHQSGAESQALIDQLDAAARARIQEYLANERAADVTEAYNRQLAQLLAAQTAELASLKAQMESVEETDRAMLPLLNRMVQALGQFIEQDTPFLLSERRQRLARLQALLLRADVSVAEKYRQILEAYRVETQYGRTLEAYRGARITPEGEQQVVFLRLGRAVLYYQTLNGIQGRLWQPASARWDELSDAQNTVLTEAIQIAQQQQVPRLLNLPLPKMER